MAHVNPRAFPSNATLALPPPIPRRSRGPVPILEAEPIQPKACWIVPFERNHRFIGRETQLQELEAKFFVEDRTQKTAIMGLGGVGKTNLVLELMYQTREKHPDCSILWITAINMEGIQQGFLNVAKELIISGYDPDHADVKKLVQEYLSKDSSGQWLLVFDNCDDIDISADNEDAAKELLEELTGLPLAIVQAAAYINENEIDLKEYLALLTEQEEDVIDLLSTDFEDEGRDCRTRNPVATTWLVSFDQIRRRDPLAAEYLSFIACLDRKDIPQSLLPPGTSRKKETDAIGTLAAYSYVLRRHVESMLDIHRLVHLGMRNWLRNADRLTHWSKKAMENLNDVLPGDFYAAEGRNRNDWSIYLLHASYALQSTVVDTEWENKSAIAEKVGGCLLADGRYGEARSLFEEVLETRRAKLGAEHRDSLWSMFYLGMSLNFLSMVSDAETIYEQLLISGTRALDFDDRLLCRTRTELVWVYAQNNRLEEAEALGTQTVESSIKVLGVDDPDTMICMSHLAYVYSALDRLEEAEELSVQLVESKRRILGGEHPGTLTCLNNLASIYAEQGKLIEAELLYLHILAVEKRILRQDHPDLLTSMNNLALTFSDQGHFDEAERFAPPCYRGRKENDGRESSAHLG